jgi:hypothetical protein
LRHVPPAATKVTWRDTSPCDGQGTTPVARQSPSRVHHILGNTVSPFHDQLPGDLQSSWQYSPPR